ncbi:MAG: hypothetical protein LBM12_01415 [Candidatus Nomurabacteria bacterium]|jgi:lipopolysaccharide biosynthesis glycosyltransferase|nr:hypothetical protein [Candidatus Nomurabacteria bacterium]
MQYCVFSTSDDNYAPMAITSLLTCRQQMPDLPLFLFGSHFSATTKQLASRKNVELVEIMQSDFTQSLKTYPVECFFWFLAPKTLKNRGFKKAVFIDGDICCGKPFGEVLNSDFGDFAGYFETRFIDMFQNDLGKINQLWQGQKRLKTSKSIQSGVVFIDLVAYERQQIAAKIIELFKISQQNGIPRPGDDSLFALLQYLHTELKCTNLGAEYDYIVRRLPLKGVQTKNIIFYHFTGLSPKPWTPWLKIGLKIWLEPWWYLTLPRFWHFRRVWRRLK